MSRKLLVPLAAATIAVSIVAGQATPAPVPHTATKKHKPIPPPAPLLPTPESGPAAFGAEQRLANMTARLKLSPDQQAQLRPVLEDTEARVRDARARGTKPAVVHDKVEKILEDADVRIRVVLDGAQKEEWEKVKQEVKLQSKMQLRATTLE